jgi:hypothetical protein
MNTEMSSVFVRTGFHEQGCSILCILFIQLFEDELSSLYLNASPFEDDDIQMFAGNWRSMLSGGFIARPEPNNSLGVKGGSKSGTICALAAIGNVVIDAL